MQLGMFTVIENDQKQTLKTLVFESEQIVPPKKETETEERKYR